MAASPYGNRPADQTELLAAGVLTLPEVYVDAATAGDGVLDVVIENRTTSLVGALRLVTSVRDASGRIWQSAVQPGTFALAPGAVTQQRVVHRAAELPAGSYVVRTQVYMNDLALGWNDVAMEFPSTLPFAVTLDAAGMQVAQYGNEVFEPLTGPNADPGELVTMAAFAETSTPRVLRPVIRVREHQEVGRIVAEYTLDARRVAGRSLQKFEFPAPQTAGSYLLQVQFRDEQDQVVSSMAADRIVVRGTTASVVSALVSAVSRTSGDYTYLTVHYSGAPDAETVVRGTLEASIRDEQGTVGATKPLPVELDDRLRSGDIRVGLNRDVHGDPTIVVTLRDEQGTVLDQYEATLTLPADVWSSIDGASQWQRSVAWMGILGVTARVLVLALAIVALGVLVKFLRQLEQVSFRRSVIAFSTLVAMSAHIVPVSAYPADRLPVRFNTNGINAFTSLDFRYYSHEYDNGHLRNSNMPYAQIFVNKPVHNSTLRRDQLDAVPLEYSVQFGVCHNHIAGMAVYARYDRAGGVCHATLNPTGVQWTQVHENWVRHYARCGNDATVSDRFRTDGDYFCIASHQNAYSGTVNLSGLQPGARVVTLQIYGKASHVAGETQPNNSTATTDVWFRQRTAHAVNVCLNVTEAPRCGDGIVNQASEQCDDGNTNNTDGCDTSCRIAIAPRCGDGIVNQASEQCDDGNTNNADRCSNACRTTFCTDGVVQNPNGQGQSEQCDDGNSVNNDACSNACRTARCGDGIVNQVSEQCDDGNTNNADSCDNTCRTAAAPRCGDGIVNQASEQCDDGNAVNNDACSNACRTPRCQDGIVQAGEQCDDGNSVNNDACSNICRTARCGDGIVNQANEQCDDGNTINTDSCDNACRIPVAPVTDLQIQKTGPATTQPNAQLQYTLTYRNNGPTAAPATTITDPVPSYLTFISSSDADCRLQGASVVCSEGTVAVGQTGTITLTYRVSSSVPNNTTILNEARIGTTATETTLANNVAQAQTVVQFGTPALTINKTGPAVVTRGQQISYTIVARNASAFPATGVVVADFHPAELTFVSASSSVCTPRTDANQRPYIHCNTGTLAAGQQVSYILTYTVKSTAVCGATFFNQADIQAAGGLTTDWSKVMTTVQCPATYECFDGLDNDHDGAADYPADRGCNSPTDDDERNPLALCQDGQDNDGDGRIDFPNDPGCDSPQDMDELNTSVVCPANGVIRMRVEFFSVQNSGLGDALPQLEMSNGTTVPAGENITLFFNGTSVIDGSLPTRRGLNVRRVANGVTFRLHGNLANGNESMQGRFIIEGGRFTGLINGPDVTDPLEEQGNNSFDMSAGNDEVFFLNNARVIPFHTTVSNGSDNFRLMYAPDPTCVTTSSSSSSSSSSSVAACLPIVAGHPQVNRGSALPFVVTTQNTGITTNVGPVTVSIPSGTAWNSAYSPSFCQPQGNQAICTIPASVQPGASYSFVYFVDVPTTAACGAYLTASATACGRGSNTVSTFVTCPSSSSSSSTAPQCRDGRDNDGDGYVDFAQDGGCSSPDDNDETGVTQCSDHQDNDHDGWVDLDDMDCQNAQDNSEGQSTPTFQCNDSFDNDGDGRVDFGSDYQCVSPYDDSEGY